MTCCPLQDMYNTYQSSLQMWLPAPEQVNEASKHFTSAWTNWTRWVTKHSRGKGEKEMLEFGGRRSRGWSRVHRTKMMLTCMKLSKNKQKFPFFFSLLLRPPTHLLLCQGRLIMLRLGTRVLTAAQGKTEQGQAQACVPGTDAEKPSRGLIVMASPEEPIHHHLPGGAEGHVKSERWLCSFTLSATHERAGSWARDP